MKASRRNKWILGGTAIALTVIGMSMLSLNSYTVYFYTPDEAFAKAAELQEKEIKVGGMVKGQSVVWRPEELALSFVLSDMGKTEIQVAHKGTPPDMFKENSGVVVEGRISPDGSTFIAKSLMVKHSEEYKVPDATHSIDKALLEKSIFKK